MEVIRKQYSSMISPLMREMVLFFSRFTIISNSYCLYQLLYSELLQKELTSKTIWSTLNYDCLAELSACSFGAKLNYFKQPNNEHFTLLKLHGSCNFMIANLSASPGIKFSGNISFGGSLKAVQPTEVSTECGKNVIQPSMSFYMKGKPNQVCPQEIEKIRAMWQSLIKQARKVFVRVRYKVIDINNNY